MTASSLMGNSFGKELIKYMKHIALSLALVAALMCCSCRSNAAKSGITAEQALEGVCNYCRNEYDWSRAEDNASLMTIEMGGETETEYQVVFRSYTGAYVYFYVDKKSGTTRMVEHVPNLDITEEAGSLELKDYL